MGQWKVKQIFHEFEEELHEVKELLKSEALELDPFIDATYGIYDGLRLIGTGSVGGKTIRSICIHKDYRDEPVINQLVTYLVKVLYRKGMDHVFLYTKPESKKSFEYLGFSTVVETQSMVLMDSKAYGLDMFVGEAARTRKANGGRYGKTIGSIVMNGNPFTLGHRHLVQEALKTCDELYLFVVWEDQSIFPNDVRYSLIQEGLSGFANVHVVKGVHYIISSTTFPTYFLKEDMDAVEEHARLDVTVFAERIAPGLGISKRYVGEEKTDIVTRKYNEALKEILPSAGIELIEIPRLCQTGTCISASTVRVCIQDGRWEQVKSLVPTSTYVYLKSGSGQEVVRKIKEAKTFEEKTFKEKTEVNV